MAGEVSGKVSTVPFMAIAHLLGAMSIRGASILLVEDDPQDALLFSGLLKSNGATAHFPCPTLADAAERLRKGDVDAVLLDLRLPDGEGVRCVEAVLKASSAIPIVVLTGMEDESLAMQCLKAGAQDYIHKRSVQADALQRSIMYACARVEEREQRRRADDLREHLATIVDVSHDGIISTTREGLVMSWNPGASKILGYAAPEVLGKPLPEVVLSTEAEKQELRHRMQREPEASDEPPLRSIWRRKDGEDVHVSIAVSTICNADGVPLGAAAIFRDVTLQTNQEQQLRQVNEHLRRREKEMQALAAKLNATQEEERARISRQVHDELGQLLTGIKMDLRWIHRHIQGETRTSSLLQRVEEAEQLADQTVKSVQDIAVALRPSVLDALGLPAAIRDEARRFGKRCDLRIKMSVDADVKPDSGAATALFRVFQELLTNVVRHASAATVHVTLAASERYWLLTVEDDGIGIPPDLHSREPRLGLLGIQERLEPHKGKFELSSPSTGGTIALVQIPRSNDAD